jgi:ATP-binding cassette, subfamily B, bacterial MsbA
MKAEPLPTAATDTPAPVPPGTDAAGRGPDAPDAHDAPGGDPEAPDRPLRERLRRVAPYFGDSRTGLVVAALASVVAALTEPMIPALLKQLLDRGFQSSSLPLWMVPVAIIGLFAIRGAAGFVAQYALAWAGGRAVLALRRAMFARVLDAHPELFVRQSVSSLGNTIVYEVQAGAVQLVNSSLVLVRDSLTLLALLGYLLYLNWALTLFVAILFPVVALVMRAMTRRLHRLTVQGLSVVDELGYSIEENALAWRIVRLHGASAAQAARFGDTSERLRRLSLKSLVAAAAMTPVTQILAACALSGVIVVALWQSSNQGGSVGEFVAFVTAMLMLIAPVKHLSEVAGPITRGLAALDRAVALIDDSPREQGGDLDPGRSRGHVQLQDVRVQYRPDQAPALDGVTLELRPGESVALVGPSGAGKTTLVNLLPRFVDASAGRILIDGIPMQDWRTEALRRQFALVSQDVVLFNDSLAGNVSLADDPADPVVRQRVRQALQAANLLDFAEASPAGLDTPVGHNGSSLSGGQRQRLAIARALYKDAPILILDEATSALDNESERLVQQALEGLMRDRTTLVIAHRLSTIESADRIVAMEAGRIVEQGTHAELLAQGGLYARLHALQFRS